MRPKPAARCCQSIPSWLNRDPNSIARLLDFRQLQLHDEYQGGCEPRSLSHGHLGDDPTGGDLVHHRVHLPGLALVEGMGGSWGSSVREIVGCKLEQKDQKLPLVNKKINCSALPQFKQCLAMQSLHYGLTGAWSSLTQK